MSYTDAATPDEAARADEEFARRLQAEEVQKLNRHNPELLPFLDTVVRRTSTEGRSVNDITTPPHPGWNELNRSPNSIEGRKVEIVVEDSNERNQDVLDAAEARAIQHWDPTLQD